VSGSDCWKTLSTWALSAISAILAAAKAGTAWRLAKAGEASPPGYVVESERLDVCWPLILIRVFWTTWSSLISKSDATTSWRKIYPKRRSSWFTLVRCCATYRNGNRHSAAWLLPCGRVAGYWSRNPIYVSLDMVPGSGTAAADMFRRVTDARSRFIESRGIDRFYGRRVFTELKTRGIAQICSDGRMTVAAGGSPFALFARLSTVQLREPIAAYGEVTEMEIDTYCDLLADPAHVFTSLIMIATWGRKPGGERDPQSGSSGEAKSARRRHDALANRQ
jgi:hypothetical protein